MRAWLIALVCILRVPTHGVLAAAMDVDQAVALLADRMVSKQEGNIAQVKGDTIYIALGSGDGILEGSQFDVVRLGDPIQDGGRLIGYEEKLIGKASALSVRANMTVAKLLGNLEQLRPGDKAYLASSPVKRVVVAPFLFDGKVTALSQNLQENLITALLGKGIAVVERSQLEQVLAEQKLGYSGLVQLDSAKKLGQLLGADAMVMGSLTDQGNEVDVNARLVALESGTGLSGAQARIAKTPIVAEQMARTVDGGAKPAASTANAQDAKSTGKKGGAVASFQNERVRIDVISLVRDDAGLMMTLKFTNLEPDLRVFTGPSYGGSCYLADYRDGSQVGCEKVSWGEMNSFIDLVPKVSVVGRIHFATPDVTAEKFSFLSHWDSRVDAGRGPSDFRVILQDIPVQ